jgi:exodeoxyribonuclease VII large subunit
MIEYANKWKIADVLIVGRGGGSIEDLLPFSEEYVVRAAYASEIPVISAVGHETDWSLLDYAADLRAPTPSAAADLVTAEQQALNDRVLQLKETMVSQIQRELGHVRMRKEHHSPEVLSDPLTHRITTRHMRVDELRETLVASAQSRLTDSRHRLQLATSALNSSSPREILSRGYALITDPESGKTLSSISGISEGSQIKTHLSDGSFTSTVSSIEKGAEDEEL